MSLMEIYRILAECGSTVLDNCETWGRESVT